MGCDRSYTLRTIDTLPFLFYRKIVINREEMYFIISFCILVPRDGHAKLPLQAREVLFFHFVISFCNARAHDSSRNSRYNDKDGRKIIIIISSGRLNSSVICIIIIYTRTDTEKRLFYSTGDPHILMNYDIV